jgi:hypothetical protein
MRNYLFLYLAVVSLVTACKSKPEEPPKNFVSVLSLIQSQVAHVDTSLYSIRKIITIDTLPGDTTYIRREDFRAAAKEFLEIPDLSDPKVAKRYKEENRYDKLLDRVMVTYTPIKPEKEEIQKQEISVTPNIATGDKVNNIMIDRLISNRDGFLEKKMLWQMDKSFLVTTITQKPGEAEKITVTKVIWNEDRDAFK